MSFGHSDMYFLYPYLAPKFFCFLCILLLIFLHGIFTDLVKELFLKVLFSPNCLTLSEYLFSLFSLYDIFWVIVSSFWSFFFWLLSFIFQPCFVVLLCFFKWYQFYLCVTLCQSWCMLASVLSSIFVILFMSFGHSDMYFLYSYLAPKFFCFLYILLLIFLHGIFTDLVKEFSFMIFESTVFS